MEIITENETHLVTIEKIQGKWWLDLIERATGLHQILVCNTKAIAKATVKGMSMDKDVRDYQMGRK